MPGPYTPTEGQSKVDRFVILEIDPGFYFAERVALPCTRAALRRMVKASHPYVADLTARLQESAYALGSVKPVSRA